MSLRLWGPWKGQGRGHLRNALAKWDFLKHVQEVLGQQKAPCAQGRQAGGRVCPAREGFGPFVHCVLSAVPGA